MKTVSLLVVLAAIAALNFAEAQSSSEASSVGTTSGSIAAETVQNSTSNLVVGTNELGVTKEDLEAIIEFIKKTIKDNEAFLALEGVLKNILSISDNKIVLNMRRGIKSIKARKVFNFFNEATVEVDLVTEMGVFHPAVPSGASTGVHEALELRNNGKGVLTAIKNFN